CGPRYGTTGSKRSEDMEPRVNHASIVHGIRKLFTLLLQSFFAHHGDHHHTISSNVNGDTSCPKPSAHRCFRSKIPHVWTLKSSPRSNSSSRHAARGFLWKPRFIRIPICSSWIWKRSSGSSGFLPPASPKFRSQVIT